MTDLQGNMLKMPGPKGGDLVAAQLFLRIDPVYPERLDVSWCHVAQCACIAGFPC